MTKMAVVTTYKDAGDIVIIEGEASGSYPTTTRGKKRPKLNLYRRSFIWVKGKYILVLDNVNPAAPADITWMMQGKQLTTVDAGKSNYRLRNGTAVCYFQVVSNSEAKGRIVTSTADAKGKPLGLKQLRLTAAQTAGVRFASIYYCSAT